MQVPGAKRRVPGCRSQVKALCGLCWQGPFKRKASKQVARTADFAVRVFSSVSAVNQRRGADGELWQTRFFDRALRTVKEYNEKVECIHLNPVRSGLVSRPEDWRRSSYNEYAGMSAEEQNERCGLIVDRVRMPSDPRARI
jgi:hypothetical protein